MCDVLELASFKLMLQVELLDLFFLSKQLVSKPAFQVFDSLAKLFKLVVVLSLDLLLNAIKEPLKFRFLSLHFLPSLIS